MSRKTSTDSSSVSTCSSEEMRGRILHHVRAASGHPFMNCSRNVPQVHQACTTALRIASESYWSELSARSGLRRIRLPGPAVTESNNIYRTAVVMAAYHHYVRNRSCRRNCSRRIAATGESIAGSTRRVGGGSSKGHKRGGDEGGSRTDKRLRN